MSGTAGQDGVDLIDAMVPMRDGVRLATDVLGPATIDPGTPVLLFRTPYSKDEMAERFGFARWFAGRGYIVVQQDCRGCYKSEGEVGFLGPEAEDGHDTLAWIAAQPWGRGRDVGAWGTSWSGWTQTAMAAMGPPNLKTIVPMMSGSDAWSSSVRQGGTLELRWIAWAFWHAAENTQAELAKTPEVEAALIHPARRFSDWLRTWPIGPGETQLALTPAYERWAFELMRNEDRTAYWASPSLNPRAHRPRFGEVSALYIGAWYDSYARASVENYLDHVRSGSGKARLLMGPWVHGTATVEEAFSGGVAFSADAALDDYRALLLAWFDAELKGVGPGVQAATPVRLYVMGGGEGGLDANGRLVHGGRWRDEVAWPLARADYRRLYLGPDGALTSQRPVTEGALSFVYDPADPAPTLGGSLSSLSDVMPDAPSPEAFHRLPAPERNVAIAAPGGFDQDRVVPAFRLSPDGVPPGRRKDVLVFQTEPLAMAMEVTGPIEVHLWVGSTAPDTDFTAKLIDVYPTSPALPDGFALNLTDGIVRLRYRDGSGVSRPVPAGELVQASIILYPTSNLFAAGHRIRLDISSANFPRFDRNPNGAANTVHFGPDRPSHIVLPFIPTAPANTA